MSRIDKLLARLMAGQTDQAFAFDDLCLLLDRAGFTRRAGRGSHRIYFKPGIEDILNLQPRGNQAKPYQVRQVRDLILKHQIRID